MSKAKKHLRSELTEDALGANIRRALAIGITDVLLQTPVVLSTKGPDVGLHHGDTSDCGVTDRVLAADGASAH